MQTKHDSILLRKKFMKNEYSYARQRWEERRLRLEANAEETGYDFIFEPRPIISQKHPARIYPKYRKLTPQEDNMRDHRRICRVELIDYNKDAHETPEHPHS